MLAETKSKELALQNFGGRDEMRELADRLCKLMPSAQNLTAVEATAVAQVALAHGLDPFNGEVWGLKSYDGKWYGVTVGIKGLRKSARREADAEGGTYWTDFARVEPKKYNAPDTAVVYECSLRDTVTVQAWAKSVHALTDCGIPYQEAVKMMGACPIIIGVGIATADEKSKMDIHARAKKRAEASAIKQRYDINFQNATISEDETTEAEEQSAPSFDKSFAVDAAFAPVEEKTPEDKKAQALQAALDLYGPQ